MKTILLSFEPEWFEKVQSGKVIFEYRKQLPKEPVTVFFYVSRPIKAITGIAHFSAREPLADWLEKYSNRGCNVTNRIREYLEECNYVCRILDFQPTNQISLNALRNDLSTFIVPRMYYYIQEPSLVLYLNTHLIPSGDIIINDFSQVKDDNICFG